MKILIAVLTSLLCIHLSKAEEPEIIGDAEEASVWIARAMSASGYELDFSVESLQEIDRFFEEHTANGKAVEGGLLSQDLGHRLFAIGSYLGEVLVKHGPSKWEADESNPDSEVNLAIVLPNGTKCWPVQRAIKRFRNGSEDGIHIYGLVALERGGEEE